MANLYITEQGAALRKTGDRLIVEKSGAELLEVECFKLEAVFAFGGVHITSPALAELLQHGISLVLLTRDGRLKGRLVPPLAKNAPLRLAQYERRQDDDFCLDLARRQVAAKISSTSELLARHARNHPNKELDDCVRLMRRYEAKADAAGSLDNLLGIEGIAARVYFEGLGKACRRELEFPGRRRRPPTDPVNALLSLGYVMLTAELAALLEGSGFDPHIGFYHQVDYGRQSLALDLLEEFRVVIDQLVLRVTNLGMVKASDFEERTDQERTADALDEPGVRLKTDSFRAYLRAYSEHMEGPITEADGPTTTRAVLKRQVQRLAAHVQDLEPYVACRLRP